VSTRAGPIGSLSRKTRRVCGAEPTGARHLFSYLEQC
jgi:hypothetical protein